MLDVGLGGLGLFLEDTPFAAWCTRLSDVSICGCLAKLVVQNP